MSFQQIFDWMSFVSSLDLTPVTFGYLTFTCVKGAPGDISAWICHKHQVSSKSLQLFQHFSAENHTDASNDSARKNPNNPGRVASFPFPPWLRLEGASVFSLCLVLFWIFVASTTSNFKDLWNRKEDLSFQARQAVIWHDECSRSCLNTPTGRRFPPFLAAGTGLAQARSAVTEESTENNKSATMLTFTNVQKKKKGVKLHLRCGFRWSNWQTWLCRFYQVDSGHPALISPVLNSRCSFLLGERAT